MQVGLMMLPVTQAVAIKGATATTVNSLTLNPLAPTTVGTRINL